MAQGAAQVNAATFRAWRAWLTQQTIRQDPIGDFARDYLADPCSRRYRTLSGLDRHMRDDHDAVPRALAARDRAWREWRAHQADEEGRR